MMLKDIREYVASLNIADKVYMGKLDAKEQRVIGVYNSKHQHQYKKALGGVQNESYGIKYITLLVHWNKSPSDTEKAAQKLFKALYDVRDVAINNKLIKFIQPLYNPQDIGTDDQGIYEVVIEVAVFYNKEENT